MPPRRRLGVALVIDPPHADQIDGLRRAVSDGSLGRVPAHITLVPPVNVKAVDQPAAFALLRAAASTCGRPLRLTLGPPASFLPANPVLYLPVGGDLESLRRLRDAVFAGPLRRRLAWPWVPHVTLADEADPARIERALGVLAGYQVVVTIDRAVILEERFVDGAEPLGSVRPSAAIRRWVPLVDAGLLPAVVVGRGGVEVTLVQGRVLGPDARAVLPVDCGHDLGREPIVLSAVAAGCTVGVAAAWRADAGARIAVVVTPDHRAMGIGRQLLTHTEDAVRRAGWDCELLHAVGPAGFYAACGNWSVAG